MSKNSVVKIRINDRVWWKIIYLTHSIRTENLGILTGTVTNLSLKDGGYTVVRIEDVHIIEQSASMTRVKLDLSKYAKWMTTHPDENEKMIGWYHSHNDMDTFFSGTDQDCINMFLRHLNVVVSLVSARKREFPYIRLICRADGNVIHNDAKIQVTLSDENDITFPNHFVPREKYPEIISGADLVKFVDKHLDEVVFKNSQIEITTEKAATVTIPETVITELIEDHITDLIPKNTLLKKIIPAEVKELLKPQLAKVHTTKVHTYKPTRTYAPSYTSTRSYTPSLTSFKEAPPLSASCRPQTDTDGSLCPICQTPVSLSEGHVEMCSEREGNPNVHKPCCASYRNDCATCVFDHPTPEATPTPAPIKYPTPIPRTGRFGRGSRWECPLCGKRKFKTLQACENHIVPCYHKHNGNASELPKRKRGRPRKYQEAPAQ